MNDRKGERAGQASNFLQFGMTIQFALAHVQQEILPVPPGDPLVLPDHRPDRIDGHVSVRLEQAGPEGRPLLVYMPGAPLEGDRGRERDDRRCGGEGRHQRRRG